MPCAQAMAGLGEVSQGLALHRTIPYKALMYHTIPKTYIILCNIIQQHAKQYHIYVESVAFNTIYNTMQGLAAAPPPWRASPGLPQGSTHSSQGPKHKQTNNKDTNKKTNTCRTATCFEYIQYFHFNLIFTPVSVLLPVLSLTAFSSYSLPFSSFLSF